MLIHNETLFESGSSLGRLDSIAKADDQIGTFMEKCVAGGWKKEEMFQSSRVVMHYESRDGPFRPFSITKADKIALLYTHSEQTALLPETPNTL